MLSWITQAHYAPQSHAGSSFASHELLGLLLFAGAAGALAQAPPAPVTVPAVNANIEFYLAHGDADACGRGCNEWIVAEGKIDLDAALRLRTLLLKLGGRRPPLYVHSPGGSVSGSIALGRLIREQRLTVSVAHTVAVGCDNERLSEAACKARKRSGQAVDAEFDPTVAMCNSGCVLLVAAGVNRLVPPFVKLGIHDAGFPPTRGLRAAPPRRRRWARPTRASGRSCTTWGSTINCSQRLRRSRSHRTETSSATSSCVSASTGGRSAKPSGNSSETRRP